MLNENLSQGKKKMETIQQEVNKTEAKLYGILDKKIKRQIDVLRRQKADAELKKNNASNEAVRQTWLGMHTAYSNALSELELIDWQMNAYK
jgi:uncharacterized protein (DUF3084 family)